MLGMCDGLPVLEYKLKRIVTVQDFDDLVMDTYQRPYSLQQQDGCMARGTVTIDAPDPDLDDCDQAYDYETDEIPEEVNGSEMGVSFKAWLARDPEKPVGEDSSSSTIILFWERNFYPSLESVVADLSAKGLIEPGEYSIEIDW